MHNANTLSIENVFATLDADQRLVPYLKLKGHISYKAIKLTGQYLAKTAKALADNESITSLDTFNAAMGYLRSQPDEDTLMTEMGLESNSGMWETIVALVRYGNKLNLDAQEILDPRTPQFPEGRQRTLLGAKWNPGFGICVTDAQRYANWTSGLAFHQTEKDALDTETYEQYIAKNPELGDFLLSEPEWQAAQVETNLYDDFGATIVDVLMLAADGMEESDFEDLPIRVQISAIESMRSKLPDMVTSALKRVNSNRTLDKAAKTAEASKQKGLILGMDRLFCEMLDSSRYANFHEFMYNYCPAGSSTATVETRDMRARQEAALERSNARRRLTGLELKAVEDKEKAEQAEREAAFGDMVSDTL